MTPFWLGFVVGATAVFALSCCVLVALMWLVGYWDHPATHDGPEGDDGEPPREAA